MPSRKLLWILLVVTFLIVLGTAAYSFSREGEISQQSAAATVTDAVATSTLPDHEYGTAGKLKTYTDLTNGFSIAYDPNLTLEIPNLDDQDPSSTHAVSDPTAQSLVSIKSGPETVTIGVSPDPADVGNCSVGTSRASKVQINGISFLTYDEGDVAMGQYYDEVLYKTVHNASCWTISVSTQGEENNRLSPTEIQKQDADIAAASAVIDPVVKSFMFTTDTSAAVPPTCTLSSEKYSYALGDQIQLTWTSKGATRALWYQPLEENTGVRKNIVPPQDTPAVNGSATTIANIEGSQQITMQVTGPGGFGTCSTDVNVTHSNVKPSITISSGSIHGTGREGPNVTIGGTAYNGALLNDAVNLVLLDPDYSGPYDEASVYRAGWRRDNAGPLYSGGTSVDLRTDSLLFEKWSVQAYAPAGITRVRVLAYPYYSSQTTAAMQPLFNTVLDLTQ